MQIIVHSFGLFWFVL